MSRDGSDRRRAALDVEELDDGYDEPGEVDDGYDYLGEFDDDEHADDRYDEDAYDDGYEDDDEIPEDEQPAAPSDRNERWHFATACFLGLLVGGSVFWWMLSHNGTQVVPDPSFAGSFFDIQGRAILDGHLDVPNDSLGIEGFVVDGRTYAYFGPVPAILRLPILAVTDQLDGRLSVLSIALAWIIASIFASLLLWRVRRFVRGDLPFTRTEFAATALGLAALGGGSSLVILAARPIVYQEADVWGTALTLASLWAVLGVLERLTYRRLAVASACATLAFLTRATLGLVATVTLAAVTVAVAGEWLARRRRPGHDSQRLFGRAHFGWGLMCVLVVATIVPVAAYASVNHAKFDTAFRLPMETQVASGIDPKRKEMLRANDNAFFRPGFMPTTALTYFRPDGIRVSRDFPFVYLPEQPQAPIGDYVFDRIDPTPGLLPTMPFWAGLTLWGLFCAFRPRPRCRPAVKRLRTPVLGAALGTMGVLSIAFIAPRYLGDFLPFLVLAGAVGLYDVVDRTDGSRRWVRAGLLGALALATVASMVVNLAIGYTIRSVEGTDADITAYLKTRLDAGDHAGDRLSTRLQRGARPPREGGADQLFVMGDCDGLYWSDGIAVAGLAITNWRPIERGPAAGAHPVGIRFGTPPPGTPSRQPVLGIDDKLAPTTLYVERLADDQVRFSMVSAGADAPKAGETITIDPDREYEATFVADPQTGELSATLDGQRVFDTFAVAVGPQHLGRPGAQITDAPPPTSSPSTTRPPPTTKPAPKSTTTTRPSRTPSSSTPPTSIPAPAAPPKTGPPIAPAFTGTITERPADTPLCRALLADQ